MSGVYHSLGAPSDGDNANELTVATIADDIRAGSLGSARGDHRIPRLPVPTSGRPGLAIAPVSERLR
jgi:hypothetical protein